MDASLTLNSVIFEWVKCKCSVRQDLRFLFEKRSEQAVPAPFFFQTDCVKTLQAVQLTRPTSRWFSVPEASTSRHYDAIIQTRSQGEDSVSVFICKTIFCLRGKLKLYPRVKPSQLKTAMLCKLIPGGGGGGVLQVILGEVVPLGSPNPDPISDRKM